MMLILDELNQKIYSNFRLIFFKPFQNHFNIISQSALKSDLYVQHFFCKAQDTDFKIKRFVNDYRIEMVLALPTWNCSLKFYSISLLIFKYANTESFKNIFQNIFLYVVTFYFFLNMLNKHDKMGLFKVQFLDRQDLPLRTLVKDTCHAALLEVDPPQASDVYFGGKAIFFQVVIKCCLPFQYLVKYRLSVSSERVNYVIPHPNISEQIKQSYQNLNEIIPVQQGAAKKSGHLILMRYFLYAKIAMLYPIKNNPLSTRCLGCCSYTFGVRQCFQGVFRLQMIDLKECLGQQTLTQYFIRKDTLKCYCETLNFFLKAQILWDYTRGDLRLLRILVGNWNCHTIQNVNRALG